MGCPFCELIKTGRLMASDEVVAAFADAFPLTPGHTLVVPRRHEPNFLYLSEREHAAMWRLVAEVRAIIDRDHRPQG